MFLKKKTKENKQQSNENVAMAQATEHEILFEQQMNLLVEGNG
jgi:hypothetical protein